MTKRPKWTQMETKWSIDLNLRISSKWAVCQSLENSGSTISYRTRTCKIRSSVRRWSVMWSCSNASFTQVSSTTSFFTNKHFYFKSRKQIWPNNNKRNWRRKWMQRRPLIQKQKRLRLKYKTRLNCWMKCLLSRSELLAVVIWARWSSPNYSKFQTVSTISDYWSPQDSLIYCVLSSKNLGWLPSLTTSISWKSVT